VLQTLEMLARPPWIVDGRLRRHVAAEASWLRRFVERDQQEGPHRLLDVLHDVCDRHIRSGLWIEVNDAEARAMSERGPVLSPDALAALAGALDEALVNVAKHSRAAQATVRVGAAGRGVTISVLDQGVGFDPVRAAPGFGLRSSIIGRIRDVGGRATLDSAPGMGTHVELWVPHAGS
jgi:signal transduction histidine kinase